MQRQMEPPTFTLHEPDARLAHASVFASRRAATAPDKWSAHPTSGHRLWLFGLFLPRNVLLGTISRKHGSELQVKQELRCRPHLHRTLSVFPTLLSNNFFFLDSCTLLVSLEYIAERGSVCLRAQQQLLESGSPRWVLPSQLCKVQSVPASRDQSTSVLLLASELKILKL